MNRIILDHYGGVVVYGCSTCPFCHYYERGSDYEPYCCISEIKVEDLSKEHSAKEYIPNECRLKNVTVMVEGKTK